MRVSSKGCSPLQMHSDFISAFPPFVDKKGLQWFLWILNYRRFIKGAAGSLALLTEVLKGDIKMNLAFSVAKSDLSIVPTLVHPDTSAKVSLSVDVSGSHIRAVLQQDVAGSWAPLAFYSKKLSSTRSRYSTIDQDLLFRSALVCHAAAQPVFPLRIQLWYYSSPWCREYDSWWLILSYLFEMGTQLCLETNLC